MTTKYYLATNNVFTDNAGDSTITLKTVDPKLLYLDGTAKNALTALYADYAASSGGSGGLTPTFTETDVSLGTSQLYTNNSCSANSQQGFTIKIDPTYKWLFSSNPYDNNTGGHDQGSVTLWQTSGNSLSLANTYYATWSLCNPVNFDHVEVWTDGTHGSAAIAGHTGSTFNGFFLDYDTGVWGNVQNTNLLFQPSTLYGINAVSSMYSTKMVYSCWDTTQFFVEYLSKSGTTWSLGTNINYSINQTVSGVSLNGSYSIISYYDDSGYGFLDLRSTTGTLTKTLNLLYAPTACKILNDGNFAVGDVGGRINIYDDTGYQLALTELGSTPTKIREDSNFLGIFIEPFDVILLDKNLNYKIVTPNPTYSGTANSFSIEDTNMIVSNTTTNQLTLYPMITSTDTSYTTGSISITTSGILITSQFPVVISPGINAQPGVGTLVVSGTTDTDYLYNNYGISTGSLSCSSGTFSDITSSLVSCSSLINTNLNGVNITNSNLISTNSTITNLRSTTVSSANLYAASGIYGTGLSINSGTSVNLTISGTSTLNAVTANNIIGSNTINANTIIGTSILKGERIYSTIVTQGTAAGVPITYSIPGTTFCMGQVMANIIDGEWLHFGFGLAGAGNYYSQNIGLSGGSITFSLSGGVISIYYNSGIGKTTSAVFQVFYHD